MKKDDGKQEFINGESPQSKTTFSERFDFLIRRSFLTQQEVADRLKVGQPHVSGLRSGKTKASKKIISRIAEVFECNIDWLYSGKGLPFALPEEQNMPKDLKVMIDILKETYDSIESDKEKFQLQGEVYNFFKELKQSIIDRKK